MGPRCPDCGAIYDWSCSEIEERVVAPKLHFSERCRALFVLTPDEVTELQERLRAKLSALEAPWPDKGGLRSPGAPSHDSGGSRASPLSGTEGDGCWVWIRKGRYYGQCGVLRIADADHATIQLDGGGEIVSVPLGALVRI